MKDQRSYFEKADFQSDLPPQLLTAVLGLTLIFLLQANRIYAWIGDAGSALMVRVLGLVLAALAVEMILGAGAELLQGTFLDSS